MEIFSRCRRKKDDDANASEMSQVEDKRLNELKQVICVSSEEFVEASQRNKKILEILQQNHISSSTFSANGENIFHVLAHTSCRSSKILSVFGLHNDGNAEYLRDVLTIEKIEELLKTKNRTGNKLPIHLAIENGFAEYVKALLKLSPNLLQQLDNKGNNLLHFAASEQNTLDAEKCMDTIINFLTQNEENEALCIAKNSDGHTPIHLAVQNNYIHVVDKMLQMFPGIISAVDGQVNTLLHTATNKKCTPEATECQNFVLERVIENGIGQQYFKQENSDKQTPIHYAAGRGFFQAVIRSLQLCPNLLLVVNQKADTVLHLIAKRSEREAAECLLEMLEIMQKHQINPELLANQNKMGKTPIHMAISNGWFDCVSKMVKMLPNLEWALDGEENSLLHTVAQCSMPEALDCMQLVLNAMRNSKHDKQYIKLVNKKGHTPIHSLCINVTADETSKVVQMLELMLNVEGSAEALTVVDRTFRTPLHLLCSKETQGIVLDADSKNANLQLMVKLLLTAGKNVINQKTQDEHKHTALHLLVISEFPNLLRILADHHSTDITIKDAHGKMAIHYAADSALRPKSRKCLEILANWTTFRNRDLDMSINLKNERNDTVGIFLQYILHEHFTKLDATKGTVWTLACESKSTPAVEYLLNNLYAAQKDFGLWFDRPDNVPKEECLSLRPMFKNTPRALAPLFDKCIRIDRENSNDNRVELITDLRVATALEKPIQDDCNLSELEFLNYANHWSTSMQESIILHPLTQCAVHALWHQLLPCKIFWLFSNFLWLLAYITLVPFQYSEQSNTYPIAQIVAAWILGLQAALYIISEMLTWKHAFKRLIDFELHYKLICVQTFLALVVAFNPWLSSFGEAYAYPPTNWQKICAAAGVLLAVMTFVRSIGLVYLPWGLNMENYIQMLQKVFQALVICLLILVGFNQAFSQTSSQHDSQPKEWAIVNFMVMMAGEFGFTETDVYKATMDNTDSNYFRKWNLFMFIIFFVLISVTLFNFLIGLVFEKTMSMQNKQEAKCISNQINHLFHLQHSIVQKLQLFDSCFKFSELFYVAYKRDKISNQIDFNQEIKWFVEKDVNLSRWSQLCHTFQKCQGCNRNGDMSILCGNLLSDQIKDAIFEKYSKKVEIE